MKKATLTTQTFVHCPHCEESASSIDHLFSSNTSYENSFGPWYCDSCGESYKGVVRGQEVFVEAVANRRKDDALVFLRKDNILLIVTGMYFDGKLSRENHAYFYNEHTCPTNYLENIEMVVNLDTNDTDPHGIFEYVTSIPWIDLEECEDVQGLIRDALENPNLPSHSPITLTGS